MCSCNTLQETHLPLFSCYSGLVFAARRVFLPVFVEGANLSMGDMHFSQGDGEVSFCGAIEMSGFLELRWVAARCW